MRFTEYDIYESQLSLLLSSDAVVRHVSGQNNSLN